MENKNILEQMEQILSGLTEEQKEKAKACKSGKELLALLSAEGVILPDEALDAVAGGVGTNDSCDLKALESWILSWQKYNK